MICRDRVRDPLCLEFEQTQVCNHFCVPFVVDKWSGARRTRRAGKSYPHEDVPYPLSMVLRLSCDVVRPRVAESEEEHIQHQLHTTE